MQEGKRFRVTKAQPGDWVEGVVTKAVTVVAPNEEDGVACCTPQDCCDAVLAELKRRASEARNRLTRRRERE